MKRSIIIFGSLFFVDFGKFGVRQLPYDGTILNGLLIDRNDTSCVEVYKAMMLASRIVCHAALGPGLEQSAQDLRRPELTVTTDQLTNPCRLPFHERDRLQYVANVAQVRHDAALEKLGNVRVQAIKFLQADGMLGKNLIQETADAVLVAIGGRPNRR